jgi:DNA-binding SARP family transcriptional activator
MEKLQIRLLGQLEVSTNDSLGRIRLTSGSQKFLAYLLLNTGRMCRREVLMDLFWQESSPERARSCLNSALWRVRRELETSGIQGPHYLLTTDGEISFNWEGDYWLDTQIFEQTLTSILRKPVEMWGTDEASHAEQTLDLYRGELLEGIYDDWTLIERERLRTLYINSLMYLMNHHTNTHTYDKSLRFAKTLLSHDPLREDIHRNVMRLYLLLGQRGLAVQQYRACTAILDSELGIMPMEETQQLYRQILNSTATTQSSVLDVSHLQLNVEQNLHAIVRILDQAHAHLQQAASLLARAKHLDMDA